MDYDLVNRSADSGFLYFWGIESVEGCSLEGRNIGEFREGLRVAADLDLTTAAGKTPSANPSVSRST